jgi:hypothetical protein
MDELFKLLHKPPSELTDEELKRCWDYDADWVCKHGSTDRGHFAMWYRLQMWTDEMNRRKKNATQGRD